MRRKAEPASSPDVATKAPQEVYSLRRLMWQNGKIYFILLLAFWVFGLFLVWNYEQGFGIQWFSLNREYLSTKAFVNFSRFAEPPAYLIFAFLSLIFIDVRTALLVPLNGIVGLLIGGALKEFFRHPRPIDYFGEKMSEILPANVEWIVAEGFTSFPSGHTYSAFGLYTFIALSGRRWYIQLICFCIALSVALSRIFMAQHFIKDIILGSMLGVLVGILFFWFRSGEKIFNYKFFRQNLITFGREQNWWK